MEAILTEAPSAVLEVLWDAEREGELVEIIGKFIDAGIDVKEDLTDAEHAHGVPTAKKRKPQKQRHPPKSPPPD